MAIDITHVQAGELITSTLVNELIGELEKIDARVTALETTGSHTGAVEITDVYPNPAQAGADVTIIGRNFGVSVGATRVRFNGVSPTTFRPGSNDSVIVCDVPDLVGLDAAGSQVELTVSNAHSTAAREIIVLPVQRPAVGEVKVDFRGSSPDPTVAGHPADFEFLLNAEDATLPEPIKLTISPTVMVHGEDAGWQLSILDATKNVISDGKITVASGDQKPFFVHTSIPANVGDVGFVLTADAVGGGFSGTSGPQSLTVGHTTDLDPTITELTPTRVTNGTLDGSTVTVPVGRLGEIFVETHLTAAPATYNVRLEAKSDLTGWDCHLFSPSEADPKLDVQPPDRNQPGTPPFALEFIRVRVVPASNASSGTLVLTLQRTGETSSRSFPISLVRGT